MNIRNYKGFLSEKEYNSNKEILLSKIQILEAKIKVCNSNISTIEDNTKWSTQKIESYCDLQEANIRNFIAKIQELKNEINLLEDYFINKNKEIKKYYEKFE